MQKKDIAHIPVHLYRPQRVEIYIEDLQKRLHQLRDKHDLIFTECCQILTKIQEMSTHTITKHQEIGTIIQEFEEIQLKNQSFVNNTHSQKVDGDVKRLKQKFETIFQNNLRGSMGALNNIQNESNCDRLNKANHENYNENHEENNSKMESFYSLTSQNSAESLYFDQDELEKHFD